MIMGATGRYRWRPPATTGAGINIYVAANGNDSTGTGSRTAPYATPAKGASVATPGSVVHVMPGSYSGGDAAHANLTCIGQPAARITIFSEVLWGAKIIADINAGTNRTGLWIQGSYTDVMGFEVDGSLETDASFWEIGIYISNPNSGTAVSHCSVQYCKVHDIMSNQANFNTSEGSSLGGAGIMGNNPNFINTDHNILNCIVYNVGPPASVSSRLHSIYAVTTGNYCNNLVYNSCDGISADHHTDSIVYCFNTVYNIGNTGLRIGADTAGFGTNFTVNNNICVNCQFGIGEGGTTGAGNVYNNNTCFNNSSSNIGLLTGTQANTLTTDPLFVNTTAANFHLQAASPSRNSGTTAAPVFTTDLLGRTRVGTPSRGCYQDS